MAKRQKVRLKRSNHFTISKLKCDVVLWRQSRCLAAETDNNSISNLFLSPAPWCHPRTSHSLVGRTLPSHSSGAWSPLIEGQAEGDQALYLIPAASFSIAALRSSAFCCERRRTFLSSCRWSSVPTSSPLTVFIWLSSICVWCRELLLWRRLERTFSSKSSTAIIDQTHTLVPLPSEASMFSRSDAYPCSPGSLSSLEQVPSSCPSDSWSAPASSPSWLAQRPLYHCHGETSADLAPSESAHCDACSCWGGRAPRRTTWNDDSSPDGEATDWGGCFLSWEQMNCADGWVWLFIDGSLATSVSHLKSLSVITGQSWDWFHKAPSKMDHFFPIIQGWKVKKVKWNYQAC